MDVVDYGARVGTAGFVLGRLLVEPPNVALSEKLASAEMRETWPLRDPRSVAALASLGGEMPVDHHRDHSLLFTTRTRFVDLSESAWRTDADPAELRAQLLSFYQEVGHRPLPSDDNVGHQVACLGTLAARIGRAASEGDHALAASSAEAAEHLRSAHLDRVIDPILAGISSYATTRLYRSVPDLLRGFLAAHTELCTEARSHQAAK